ncbi:hypothetical protein FCULG_00012108 [Fusarium culmorum]|uniref:Uncharacterized protein n=1 Tax=Fusarium culmorum TaxID=5516 RepID=A0A2T4GFF6_FUSCU|nr:hypothetical protein FCULG_00012108 [Fusarium culmorum]
MSDVTENKPFPPTFQICFDLSVLVSLLALGGLMIWTVLAAPRTSYDAPYVIVGITFLATIYTSVVKGRVQHGLMRSLEKDLRARISYSELDQMPESSSTPTFWEKLKKKPPRQEMLNTRWRRILVIDSLKEKILYNKNLFFIYLPCALLTTAIVTVFTPHSGSQNLNYQPLVPGPGYSHNFTSNSTECAGQGEGEVSGAYRRPLGNDAAFFARYQGDCPPVRITSHVSNINSESPDKYAYVDAGVAVDWLAMGALAQLYRGTAFQKLDQKHGQFLRSTTQCVPVMASNPVTCKKGGGKLRVGDNAKSLYFVSDSPTYGPKPIRRLVEFAARSFNESSGMGETLFAKDLARTINDPNKTAGTEGSATYVVTCEINPLKSFEYRWVTLDLPASKTANLTGIAYSRRLSGGKKCVPDKQTVGNVHYVAATTSMYNMVMENYGLDGYFSTVHRVAGEDRGRPYAFNNSKNGLEDALGVIAALGLANMPLDDPVVANSVGNKGNAIAVIEINQLGGNQLLLFALTDWQPGGGLSCGRQPELYAAESVGELIAPKRLTSDSQ